MEAYCFKCKGKREMKDQVEMRMKNGKQSVTGTCVTCGAKLCRIVAPTPTGK
ncbi:MAG TPA: DUF5679 domain-containing protein [Armatimonadaceae bacterium]|jgi:hypothetical protein|nr:DUF5679 domain-containing protein [Armatimonadaceae bacterium]